MSQPIRYPSDEEARKTFSDREFTEATTDRVNSSAVVGVFSFDQYYNQRLNISPEMLQTFGAFAHAVMRANFGISIPTLCPFNLVRRETVEEAQAAVIAIRKGEMQHDQDSPHYGVHQL